MIVDAIIVGLAFYLAFPLLNGYCASHYGRSFSVWFGIGCVFPIISFIILVVVISWDEKMTPKHKLSKREKVESAQLVKDLVNKLDRPILSKKPKKNPSKQRSRLFGR